jgi:hypothetical protein
MATLPEIELTMDLPGIVQEGAADGLPTLLSPTRRALVYGSRGEEVRRAAPT